MKRVLARLVEVEAVMGVLEVDTRRPRAIRRGSTLVTSVVLPEPLQPASPMMRMELLHGPLIAKTPGR